VTGGGINGGMSHASQASTVLTTVTGGDVNIDVAKDTKLKGAMIAAVDAQGNDNGHLNLKTGTLEVSSSINRNDSSSASMGLNVGLANSKSKDGSTDTSVSSVGIDFANDNSHSKTKTLGTIGSGSVVVGDAANSDTRMLNRDINDQTVDIYSVDSHKGMKGSIDARMLTEQGRDQIAEDLLKSEMILNTVKLIATTKKVGVQDFFSETDKSNKTYEAVKQKIAESPELAAALQNKDLDPQAKEQMLNDITDAVMVKLGYKTHKNKIVATDEAGRDGRQVLGFHSLETESSYVNDKNANDTEGLVRIGGAEAVRSMDRQDGVNFDENRKDKAAYAANYGANLADYTNMALDINGYDSGMATTNSHVGTRSDYVSTNNSEFSKLDKNEGDNIPVDTIWDAGNVIYDLGKAGIGAVKGDKEMQNEGLTDAAADSAAFLIPYVPAGVTKVVGVASDAKKAEKVADETASLRQMGANNRINKDKNEKINQRAEQKAFEDKAGFQHEKSITGKKANANGQYAKGGQKEWNDTDIVKEGTLPKGQQPDTIGRAHEIEAKPGGIYLGDKTQMKGKTETQLKEEYALPKGENYNYVTDYKGTKDKQVQVGQTGKNDYGDGGNTQMKIKPGQGRVTDEDFYEGATPVEKP